MILDVPLADYVITPLEDAWAERMLEEFLPPSQNNKIHPEIKLPSGKYAVVEGLGAAVSALAVVVAVAALIQLISTYTTPKERRRRRTEICVKKCLEVLTSAQKEMKQYHNFRALEAEEESRRTRKFLSQK